jgi:DNA repair protein SbcD/Mre11
LEEYCFVHAADGWCRNHQVGLALVEELLRLRDGDCQVALLLGNHDVRTRVMKPLLLPSHAHLLGRSGPETHVLERFGVALHGWSAPEVEPPFDVAELYPPPLAGLLNIGLLHTSADGRRGHENYSPCSRRSLRRKGYDYWAVRVRGRRIVGAEHRSLPCCER